MNYKNMLCAVSIAALFSSSVQAATEYLRFEGSVYSWHDGSSGFSPSQAVHFDFMIDTAMDVPGSPDSSFDDYFSVTYLSGSVPGSDVTYGVTSSFPEGYITLLAVTDALRVGTTWDSLGEPYPTDWSIDTWAVGTWVSLLDNAGYTQDDVIGNVQLTYRDGTPPPPVPVPAAAWLFLSGLGALSVTLRRRG